jgi:hypothetical protein
MNVYFTVLLLQIIIFACSVFIFHLNENLTMPKYVLNRNYLLVFVLMMQYSKLLRIYCMFTQVRNAKHNHLYWQIIVEIKDMLTKNNLQLLVRKLYISYLSIANS